LYIAGLRVSEIAALSWRNLQPRTDGGQVTRLRQVLENQGRAPAKRDLA
jgi:hypothetical protein